MYDASYSVVQGVGARRVGDVRRVGRCRGPTRRKSPFLTVVGGGGGPAPLVVGQSNVSVGGGGEGTTWPRWP